MPGDKVVVVVSPIKRQIKELAKKSLFEVMRLFEDVMLDTCPNPIASKKKDQIDQLKRKHKINRGRAIAYEFNVDVVVDDIVVEDVGLVAVPGERDIAAVSADAADDA